ncbi:unnamed protein product [Coffea canephora]|uniref:Purple acid phosphatase N-terminal domain-containing protein n=1 Tax=Coffea canephora TaxID=49390 RepID=A0A068TYH5_COFCA|nr:unnamed protein product [Coffea canephora]
MRVMFVTHDGKDNSVRYGLTRGKMEQTVGARVLRYEREDMCHAPATDSVGWRDPGYIHDGVMTDLRKGKRYYYQVGSDSGGWSDIFSFVTPNAHLKETIAFLFGDMGTSTPYTTFDRTQEESSSTLKWISRDIDAIGDKPAFVSHIGDISYARGYSWLWDNFFNQIEPMGVVNVGCPIVSGSTCPETLLNLLEQGHLPLKISTIPLILGLCILCICRPRQTFFQGVTNITS